MIITARNYHDAARTDLEVGLQRCLEDGLEDDAGGIEMIIEVMDRAQRFSLPDNGFLLDDHLRGIQGHEVHLPFEAITIEYFKSADLNFSAPGAIPVTKRLVVAHERTVDGVEGICVCGINFVKTMWCPDVAGLFVFRRWDERVAEAIDTRIERFGDSDSDNVLHVRALAVLPTYLAAFAEQDPDAERQVMRDAAQEARVVLELCEALSCRNVRHEPRDKIDPRVNARRIRDGKKPLVESRILVLDVPGREAGGSSRGGSHASPRQHLRRGHIRRYQDGHQIWINSTVVGDASRGRISGGYAVQS